MKRKKQSAIMIIISAITDIDESEAADFEKELKSLNENNYAAPELRKEDERWP